MGFENWGIVLLNSLRTTAAGAFRGGLAEGTMPASPMIQDRGDVLGLNGAHVHGIRYERLNVRSA